jgi:hypothetical protein
VEGNIMNKTIKEFAEGSSPQSPLQKKTIREKCRFE